MQPQSFAGAAPQAHASAPPAIGGSSGSLTAQQSPSTAERVFPRLTRRLTEPVESPTWKFGP
jgi:hypothetical protein